MSFTIFHIPGEDLLVVVTSPNIHLMTHCQVQEKSKYTGSAGSHLEIAAGVLPLKEFSCHLFNEGSRQMSRHIRDCSQGYAARTACGLPSHAAVPSALLCLKASLVNCSTGNLPTRLPSLPRLAIQSTREPTPARNRVFVRVTAPARAWMILTMSAAARGAWAGPGACPQGLRVTG